MDRSTLIRSRSIACSWASVELPAPTSASAMRTPAVRSRAMLAAAPSGSRTTARSVISRTSREAGTS